MDELEDGWMDGVCFKSGGQRDEFTVKWGVGGYANG